MRKQTDNFFNSKLLKRYCKEYWKDPFERERTIQAAMKNWLMLKRIGVKEKTIKPF